jgi:hypothetical protein
MDSLEVRPLPGSELTGITPPPFWSPDGRFVAFDAGGRLRSWTCGAACRKLPALPSGSVAVGGSWNRDGDIIFGNFGGLLRVRESAAPRLHSSLDAAQRIPSASDFSPGRPALRLLACVAWSAGGRRRLHRHPRREA